MPTMDPAKAAELRAILDKCPDSFILAGISTHPSHTGALRGSLGIVDWRLHGAISDLYIKNSLSPLNLFSQKHRLGKASLLLVDTKDPENLKGVGKQLHMLKVKRLSLLSSSFSEQELPVIEQQLQKVGVEWNRLES